MRVAAILAVVLFSSTALAETRCATRSDCGEGFRCVKNACIDEASYEALKPPEPMALDDRDRVRFYAGGAIGGILPALGHTAGEGVQVAVRGGLFYENFQVHLEVAPAAVLAGMTDKAWYMFEAAGTVGYRIPIMDIASAIVRVGGGTGAVTAPAVLGFTSTQWNTSAFGEFRAEIGMAIRTSRHLVVELDVPSFRMAVMPGFQLGMFVTNVAVDWVF